MFKRKPPVGEDGVEVGIGDEPFRVEGYSDSENLWEFIYQIGVVKDVNYKK